MRTPLDLYSFDKKAITDLLAEREPKLWQHCYPRIYEQPNCGQYHSPREVAGHLLSIAIRVRQEGLGGQLQLAELIWASRLASLRVPTYWIGNDMAQAIQQTVPPMEFDWVNSKLPFESMVFMVPRGILSHEDKEEGDATFVSFARLKTGDEIPTISPEGPRFFNIMEDAFSCFAGTNGGAIMHWTFTADRGPNKGRVNLAELDKLVQEFANWNHTSHSMFSAGLTETDNRFMARASHFIFGTILMMLAKPKFITPGILHKRIPAKANKTAKEFWLPNVIGLHYRIKHEWQGGTHASPRRGWVCGAYKEQPYGKRQALRKHIWIEPYLRGLDE